MRLLEEVHSPQSATDREQALQLTNAHELSGYRGQLHKSEQCLLALK